MQLLAQLDNATLRGIDLIEKHRQEKLDAASIEEMKSAQQRASTEEDLINDTTAAQLKGQELEVFQEQVNHEKRLAQIREIQFENEDDYLKLIELENTLSAVRQNNIAKSHNASELLKQDIQDFVKNGEQAFAQGLSGAIVDAFQEGDKAFQKFAANFLRTIAQMILQSLILRAIQSTGLGLAGGGQVTKAADGFMGGVSSATFLPRFNVLAGEAGPEMLTVMARPRFANFGGGLTGAVGDVGNRKMAVVDANGLAQRSGGQITLRVDLAEGLVASITQNSVAGARVAIAQDMSQDTPVSRATKRLVA